MCEVFLLMFFLPWHWWDFSTKKKKTEAQLKLFWLGYYGWAVVWHVWLLFWSGNHWSEHTLITLNVHQNTQRPKDPSFVVAVKWLRVRNGSQLAARHLKHPFLPFCPSDTKAVSSTMRCRTIRVVVTHGKFITVYLTVEQCHWKMQRNTIIIIKTQMSFLIRLFKSFRCSSSLTHS